LQGVILSKAKNLVGVDKTVEIVAHRFFTPLRSVQNDRREREIATPRFARLAMTGWGVVICHSEEAAGRRGNLIPIDTTTHIVPNQILRSTLFRSE